MSTYSDESDHASELEQRERDILIAAHRAKVRDGIKATGFCHNCEDPVEGGKLFCSKECAEDWAFRERLKKERGL